MKSASARSRMSLRWALGVSLLLHSTVLFLLRPTADPESGPSGRHASPSRPPSARLDASVIGRPASPKAPVAGRRTPAPARPSPKHPERPAEPRRLTTPAGETPVATPREKTDMDRFLDELATQPAPPPRGRELAERALEMARRMRSEPPSDDAVPPAANAMAIDSYSLEMYFDAFIRKLNRSAAFVRNDPRPRGYRKALVEIALNADGTLKSFRVLRSADQAAEIAYIRSVLDRAAPFSAFPPDIRKETTSLSMLMCIHPGRDGEGGGFSRSAGAECRD